MAWLANERTRIAVSNKSFRVACIQNCAGTETAPNLADCEALTREAGGAGAELILLPEYFTGLDIHGNILIPEAFAEEEHPALPLFGDLLLKLEVARLTRTLGTLLANGVSVLNAFSMTLGATQNQAVAEALSELRGRVAKGEGLARPLSELGLFPAMAVQLIEIGEESGRLEPMLLRVAEIYDEEVKRTINRLLALLVPLVTIALGVVIAVIIGAMLSAILSAYDLPF